VPRIFYYNECKRLYSSFMFYASGCTYGGPVMSVTIREVAALAGVAPSTVSRVIANSAKISPETAAKAQDAMQER